MDLERSFFHLRSISLSMVEHPLFIILSHDIAVFAVKHRLTAYWNISKFHFILFSPSMVKLLFLVFSEFLGRHGTVQSLDHDTGNLVRVGV